MQSERKLPIHRTKGVGSKGFILSISRLWSTLSKARYIKEYKHGGLEIVAFSFGGCVDKYCNIGGDLHEKIREKKKKTLKHN